MKIIALMAHFTLFLSQCVWPIYIMEDNIKMKDEHGILMRASKAHCWKMLLTLKADNLESFILIRECTQCKFLMAEVLFSAKYSA